MMVEGEADFLSETEMLEAIFFGHESLQPLIDMQETLAGLVGNTKREFALAAIDAELEAKVTALAERRSLQRSVSAPSRTLRRPG